MDTWQVFSGGTTYSLTVDEAGMTIGETVLGWSQIVQVDYPSTFNVILDLSREAAEELCKSDQQCALGFRSSADQRAFRRRLEELLSDHGDAGPARPALQGRTLASLDGLILVGGYELRGLLPGRAYSLTFSDSAVAIRGGGAPGQRITVSYAALLALGVEGPRAKTTGRGFVGGGIGLEGAAEGMLVAGLLNALTARTSVEAYVDVQDADSYWIFLSQKQTPEQLERALKPVRARLRAAHGRVTGQSKSQPSADLVGQLERLAALRDAGALSEPQFEAAKAKLLA